MADKETRSLSHPTVNGEVKKKKKFNREAIFAQS